MSAYVQPITIVGQASAPFARQIAIASNAPLVPFSFKQFADGEVQIWIDNIQKIINKPLAVVYQFPWRYQSGPSVNDYLVGLLALLEKLHAAQASVEQLILPYFPYARHSKRNDPRKQGSVYMLGRSLKALRVRQIVVAEVHDPSITDFFAVPLRSLSLAPFWAFIIKQHIIKDDSIHDFCIASPDQGGLLRVQEVATMLTLKDCFVRKKRVHSDTVVACDVVGDVQGRRVILLDDILDTGNTAASATMLLKAHGAASVVGCFTHAVCSSGSLDRIQDAAMSSVYISDTLCVDKERLPKTVYHYSCNDYFAQALL